MVTDSSYPPVPSNYVTIHDLRERWMKKLRQEELEKMQQPKHEPTPSQPHQRNHVRRGKDTSSAAAIVPPGNWTSSEMAATQAEESRVSGVEEKSASLVAVEETGVTRVSKSKWQKTKKKNKKFGIDGKGKSRLDEDADGGAEHAPAGNVAGESVSSTNLLKGDTFKVEVKCVSTESKAMRQLQPKVKRHTHVRGRKVAGESIAIEKESTKIDLGRVKIQNDGLDSESLPKIKNADPANPTFKMEEEFKKLSMQDDRRTGYRGGGRGRGRGRPSLYSGGEMVWIKKVEKADDDHSGSSSKLLN